MPEGLFFDPTIVEQIDAFKTASGARLQSYFSIDVCFSPGYYDRYLSLGQMNRMLHCCGIVDWGNLPSRSASDRRLGLKNWHLMLVWALRHAMRSERVKSVVATTIPSQRGSIRDLKAIGFVPQFQTKNPKTNRVITFWLLTEG